MQWFYGAECTYKALKCATRNLKFEILQIVSSRLWYQVERLCTFSLSGTGVVFFASFNISLSVHMCWQEAICKPDSLLCDKKSDFSLTEQENTWRNSNQSSFINTSSASVKAVYQCQWGTGGNTSSLPSSRLSFTLVAIVRIFFSIGAFVYRSDCPGAFLPLGPQHHLWPWLGIRDASQETDRWNK